MAKKFIDPNKLCMGCMSELADPSKPCPHCGFWLPKYQKPANSLPPMEILNGKYLVGKVIGVGGFGITYIGWNLFLCTKVCIKEYFPKGVAFRPEIIRARIPMDIHSIVWMYIQNTKTSQ